jgi:hypothetical protein
MMFDWKDLLERTFWTFIQGFVSVWPVGTSLTDFSALKVFAGAGIIGGIAAVLAFLKNLAKQRLAAGRI